MSEHVLRLDRDGNVDRRFAIEAPDRPAYLNGGALHPWGDGFLLSFNEQLERYRGDGSLDRTFGEEGVVTTAGSFVSRLARLADGSIVRGTHSVEDGKVFTRFAANGDPHLGFGTGGRVTLAGIRSLYGLVGLDDGGFVFAANDVALSPEDFQGYVTRMTADGTLDGDFGVLGEVAVDDGSGATRGLYGIAVFEERIYGWGIRHVDGEALRGFVVAYDLTGSVDSTFGDGGFLDLGELVLPRTGVVDEEAGRLILGCARPLSPARDATRMVGVVRLWL
ncbi:MAG: hypothetical protein GWO04_26255 [Actinobacteria bacterium]|nr:hypothetical protein [Actinomycetota bacterium]